MNAVANMKVTGLASWFGSNRMLAHNVGAQLNGCSWVGVPFAGSMCELAHIQARTLLVNDIHRHVINLARVAAHPILGPKLYRQLRRLPFHPVTLQSSQARCSEREGTGVTDLYAMEQPIVQSDFPDLEWAVDYFIAAWMSRHGSAGTKCEFKAPVSLRWNAAGGDSARHHWSAVRELIVWRRVLHRANFSTLDFRAFLSKCKDEQGIGIYCDPPFADAGENYKFSFTLQDHRDLAGRLCEYKKSRVVCRFYDHPLVRELYPESRWKYRSFDGRKQTNDSAPELLLINGEFA